MFNRLERAWRWLGTASGFFLFGLGGVVLSVILFPLLRLWPGNKERHQQIAQKTIHYSFRLFIEWLRLIGVLTYEVRHAEKLENARLILSNHPSLLDVVFMIAFIPNACCVVKGKLLKSIWTRGPIRQAGYIVNDENEDVLGEANDVFDRGDALIVFPEGTRTTPRHPISLKRGASQIAVRCGVDITPVLIDCTPTTLTKQDRWYEVPARRMHFTITVKDAIEIDPFIKDRVPSRAARTLTQHLTHFFINEVSQHGQSAP
ncbi:lysophospholipid acyltransferase family protein [Marinobacter mangrovi]|uniref:lysophospholipid acyltransferase family protein n=1 Tax=Marinobacter mangrovi TaxID=2803918 RepID=UPI0019335DF9|nr:lysophospholipid acyltransferase family protein [Marinobacter mangrovi]